MIDLRLPLELAKGYNSPSQIARVVTESWFSNFVRCPACARSVTKAPNNSPGLDFVCDVCDLSFELKSKRGGFGEKLVDGAYESMMRNIATGTQSNFFLLSYSLEYEVTNLFLVPKRFIVPEIIERRKPLALSARRAGWVGCNLKISYLPAAGRVFYIKDKSVVSAGNVLSQWQATEFLDSVAPLSRSWLVAVMQCAEKIKKTEFSIQDMYEFVPYLEAIFPRNKHVKAKVRQQLQVLRDRGWLKFLGEGRYSRSPVL